MQTRRLSRSKYKCALTLVCLALVSTLILRTQNSQVSGKASSRSGTRSDAIAPGSRGRYNGKLVFGSDRQNDGGIKLWTMNPDGSNQTQLTFESERGPTLPDYVPVNDYSCKWSPDGTKIALRSNRNLDLNNPDPEAYTIYVMDYQIKTVQRLILDRLPALSLGPYAEIGGFEWSPDGTKFVLSYGEILVSGFDKPTVNIYTVNTDGSSLARLTNDIEVVNGAPTWSPDGNQIAFMKGAYEIDVMNADGANRHKIAGFTPGNPVELASWSPDGSKLLLVLFRDDEPCSFYVCRQLYTIKPDGTELRQLTYSPIGHTSPRWSPDGTKIAFVWSSAGPRNVIFVVNADGTDEHEISNHLVGIGDSVGDWQPLPAPANEPPPSVLGLNSGLYLASYPNPASIEITVTRSGNLDQTVSCDYGIGSQDSVFTPLPHGTFTFAPGETSKTFQFSYDYSANKLSTFDVAIFNNWGNATFVGGVKHAPIVLAGQNANPIDNSAYFVRQQYRDFLSREPDASGWDFWINNMDSCPVGSTFTGCQNLKPAQRVDTSAAFFLSIEFQQTGYLVYRIYKAAYGNLPGAPVPIRFSEFLPDTQQIGQGVVVGQSGWEQALETNKQNFMTSFVQRSRFTSAYPTSMTVQQFVDALYTNAGLVPTSAPNRPQAISEFNSTTPADPAARARALRDVAEDPMLVEQEFNRAFVLMQYFGYLRRNPNDAPDSDFSGYNFWLGKLNQFSGNYQTAELVKAFIVSSEYRQRFGL